MTRTLAKTLVALGFASFAVGAVAQANDPNPPFGWGICIDPFNTAPYTGPGANSRADDLFRCSLGVGGTVTYWGPNSICYLTAQTYNYAGRIGFASGPVGSIQDDNGTGAIDNDMQYTMGMPTDPAGDWSYACTIRHDPTAAAGTKTSTLFGSALTNKNYAGASGRYEVDEQIADNIDTLVRIDVLGDGARIIWQMTNLATTSQDLGLYYGAQIAILPVAEGEPNDLNDVTGLFGTPTFVTMPGRKPLLVDSRITRVNDPGNFPSLVQFCFGQTRAYGLQVDLGPTDATTDSHGNTDATNVDELVVGLPPFVVGNPLSGADVNVMPDFVFGDVGLSDEQFIIKYEPTVPVAPNATRTIISYFRDTWGNSKYIRVDGQQTLSNGRPNPNFGHPTNDQPYSTVVDAPRILTQDDGNGTNGLAHNPFVIRVYADNNGGYGAVYTGVDISDVQVHVTLPAGMSFINGDTADKIISVVHPQEMNFVDFAVQSDGIIIGDLPYTVTISSTPGPPLGSPITHTGVIRVSATKQIPLQPSANLVATPWVFADSSWESITGLSIPNDFTAYEWDPVQNSYAVSTGVTRGRGYWFILNPNTHPSPEVIPYINANTPGDTQTGTANLQLHSGWNLIGDPYPYAIPVSQLVGVSAANQANSYIFADLVAQNVVSPYLAYWDPSVNNYRYVQGQTAVLQPNVGYWIKVLTSQDLTLNYPPVWDTFVPGGKAASEPAWIQTGNHFRLQVQAKSNHGQDPDNYVGVATTQTRTLQVPKPPQGPTQDLNLAFDGASVGETAPLAQALSSHTGQLQWSMKVSTVSGGPITLNWPNMATLPTNISFKLIDAQTHQSVDMRTTHQITYMANPNTTRQFTVQSTSTATVPLITTLTTSAGRLTGKVSAGVSYSLSNNSTVTVQILDSQNRVVRTLTNAVNMTKGNKSVTWDLKNASGAYVAAGSYTALVTATGSNEQLDRKSAPVTVGR